MLFFENRYSWEGKVNEDSEVLMVTSKFLLFQTENLYIITFHIKDGENKNCKTTRAH